MDFKEFKKKIIEAIRQDKLKEAYEFIFMQLPEDVKATEIIINNAEFKRIEEAYKKNTIDWNTMSTNKNRLIDSIISFIDKIEESINQTSFFQITAEHAKDPIPVRRYTKELKKSDKTAKTQRPKIIAANYSEGIPIESDFQNLTISLRNSLLEKIKSNIQLSELEQKEVYQAIISGIKLSYNSHGQVVIGAITGVELNSDIIGESVTTEIHEIKTIPYNNPSNQDLINSAVSDFAKGIVLLK